MSELSSAYDLGAGQWVLKRGGVRVYVPTPPAVPHPPRAVPIVSVHELRACLTCTARVDERCRSRSGQLCEPHVGRLAPRLCSCGDSLSAPNALRCARCAHERHKEQQRIHVSIKRAVAREAAAA